MKRTTRRGTKEYTAWTNIKARCKSNSKDKRNYYEKGISMCPELASDFLLFLKCLGNAPSKEMEVDRIDNKLGYFEGNMRWASRSVNTFNKPASIGASKTGLPRGIYKQGNRYRSYFSVSGITIQIGYFDTAEEAATAYRINTKEWYGFTLCLTRS